MTKRSWINRDPKEPSDAVQHPDLILYYQKIIITDIKRICANTAM